MKKKVKKLEKRLEDLSAKHQQDVYMMIKKISEQTHQIQLLNYQLQKVSK